MSCLALHKEAARYWNFLLKVTHCGFLTRLREEGFMDPEAATQSLGGHDLSGAGARKQQRWDCVAGAWSAWYQEWVRLDWDPSWRCCGFALHCCSFSQDAAALQTLQGWAGIAEASRGGGSFMLHYSLGTSCSQGPLSCSMASSPRAMCWDRDVRGISSWAELKVRESFILEISRFWDGGSGLD